MLFYSGGSARGGLASEAMRSMLALLAVMTLVVSPVAALAMRTTCGNARSHAMAGMDMAVATGGVSCCGSSDQAHKAEKTCARICAALNVIGIETPHLPVGLPFTYLARPAPPSASVIGPAHRPVELERPPKLHA